MNKPLEWLREARWLNQRRLTVYPKLIAALFVLSFAGWVATGHGLIDPLGRPLGPDFINFYAASAQSLAGHASQAYDVAAHGAAERSVVGGRPLSIHLFDYPPTFILLILPLALLPYTWSLVAWILVTAGGYLAVIRRIAPMDGVMWLALAFPGAWMNVVSGQNAFLSTALFGAALLTLERFPLLAGAFCGLLTYKPQLALLMLIVLVADGRWRAVLSAVISAVVLAAIALILFGIDSWRGFLQVASLASRMILGAGANPYNMQQTLFAEFRFAGLPLHTADAAQTVVSLLVTGIVLWIWYAPVSFRVKAAALATGTLIVTPYLGYYDLTLLALPIAWLGYEGLETGFLPYEKTTLAALWLVPIVYLFLLAPWLILLLFGLIVVRVRRSRALSAAVMAGSAT